MNTAQKVLSLSLAFTCVMVIIIDDRLTVTEITVLLLASLVMLTWYIYFEHKEIGVENKIEN